MTKDKDIKLNNIKGILILLVIFGHFLSSFQKDFKGIYLFIYSFHMPLFVLLSGYFAKRVKISKIINFLLILAIFQPLYKAFLYLIKEEKRFRLEPDVPYYHLWYLFASVIWYLIAMGINRRNLKKWQKIIIIVLFFAIGITARYIAAPFEGFIHSKGFRFKGTSFSYMRIMTFLPYFFIGLFLTRDDMIKLYSCLKRYKFVNIILLIGMFVCVKFLNPVNADVIFKGKNGVAKMKGSQYGKLVYIIAGYVISLLMCFILLNLVSDRKSIFTRIGERTLPIYLFHVFIVKIIKRSHLLKGIDTYILLPLLIALSFIIALILGSDLFAKLTYYLWNPLEFVKVVKGYVNKQLKRKSGI